MRFPRMSWVATWTIGWLLAAALAAGAFSQTALRTARGQPVDMVRVEAGPFVFGSDDGMIEERPAHTLDLRAFEIDRLPVTTSQFAEFLTAVGPTTARGERLFDLDDADARIHQVEGRFVPDAGFENHPVVEPTWLGARDFCTWRGARLPTEPEWEKTARGTDGRPYPWGWEPPDPARARYGGRIGDYLPVGSLPLNVSPYGVMDMAGNVWNWVSSLFQPYPYRADDGREDLDAAGERSTRGGSHSSAVWTLRSTFRGLGFSRAPTSGHYNIGFRCARDAA